MTAASTAITARAGYLTQRHFLWMLGIACFLHLLAAIIAALSVRHHASQIPVHVMNIKLGTSELMAQAPDAMGGENMRRTVDLSSMPLPSLPAVAPTRASPAPKVQPKEAAPVVQRKTVKEPPKSEMLTPARDQKTTTAAETKYVRENVKKKASPDAAQGDPSGSELGNATGATAEIMQRYTQLISLWLQRHKVYPEHLRAQGIAGRAIIRLRINRAGAIQFFRIEQSTGNPDLDNAVIAMVRAANPVPAVPQDYPAGNLVEFLIPVNYNLR